MAFNFLESDEVFDAFNDSKKFMRPLFDPMHEFERIARNRPHAGIDKAYPKVTDGTTAATIIKTPRRIFQQMPSGLAKSASNTEWITPVSGFILERKIIPNANWGFPFMQKCQNVIGKGMTYGSQPAYVPFVNRGSYFGPDMLVPYIMDVYLEKGKVSDEDCNYIMMRSWYQPRDIKNIIATQKSLGKKAEERGDSPDYGGWDLQALADIEDFVSQKDDYAVTPAERDKNNRSGGVEIVHCFQRGIGGQFFSFHMPTQTIVRTKKNPDPRGAIPIHYFYYEADGGNPLGRGLPELVGAMQNLLDSEVQMYQYNRALMLNPPMIKRGDWNENQAKFSPNVLIDLGTNPGADYEPVKIDSTAIQSFPQNYSLMQSQLHQLMNNPQANVGSPAGNTTASKTPQGVDLTTNMLSIDDNYVRKQAEAWLEKIFETQLNLYFAEKHGVEELQLDNETADKIRDLNNGAGTALVNPDNKVMIDYDQDVEELQFFIDPGSSEIQDDQKEISELKEIISDINQNPYSMQYVMQEGKQISLGEVYIQLYEKLGLKNLDKIMKDLPKDPLTGEPQAPPLMAMDRPKLDARYESLPPAAQVQFLRNAGIEVTIDDIMQSPIVDPNVRGQAGPGMGGSNDVLQSLDPRLQAMAALKVDFSQMPEDSKQQVLSLIGFPSSQMSPTQQDLEMKAIGHSHDILNGLQPADPLAGAAPGQAPQPSQPAQQSAADSSTPPPPVAGADPGKQMSAQANQEAQSQQQSAQLPQAQQQGHASLQEDVAYAEELKKMGVPYDMIDQAVALLNQGTPAEDVLKMIQGAMQNGR